MNKELSPVVEVKSREDRTQVGEEAVVVDTTKRKVVKE
jgi:hypothetical protein